MENLLDFVDAQTFWFPVCLGLGAFIVLLLIDRILLFYRFKKSRKQLHFTIERLYEEQQVLKKTIKENQTK